MNHPILRHIKKIEYCAAYHLKRAIFLPTQNRALVRGPMPWQEIPIVGLAQVETTEEVENGMRLSTTKLTATLCQRFQLPTRPLAFRLTDVRGNQYLLGTAESPYPLVKISSIRSSKETEKVDITLSVQTYSHICLLKIFT